MWKRIFRDAGKRRSFDLLEPQIRSLASQPGNPMHPGYPRATLRPVLERSQKLLRAFDELRGNEELICAREIIDDPGTFLFGSRGGASLNVFAAGFFLVQAMLTTRCFEVHLIACLQELTQVDRDFVDHVFATLPRL